MSGTLTVSEINDKLPDGVAAPAMATEEVVSKPGDASSCGRRRKSRRSGSKKRRGGSKKSKRR